MIRILKFGEVKNSEIFSRVEPKVDVQEIVSGIIDAVRRGGDNALFAYEKQFDRASLNSLLVSQEEIQEAVRSVEPEFLEILKEAAANIRTYHEAQKRTGFEIKGEDGTVLGQEIVPIEKVGLYVPGGTAAYPSTVLMDSIPARIAGCSEVVITTPPGPNGKINPAILAAAYVAGVDRVYKVGGAQAVAALAYGTETVGKVDKIVGPGNAFVAEAKRQVFGKVAIDMIAGPSEIMIVSDAKSDAYCIAADLLSQAEHDRLASAVLVTDSYEFARKVRNEIEKQLCRLPRESIARESIDNNGKIIVAENLTDIFGIVNEIAPEHLELCLDEPFKYLPMVKNAGSIFLGRNCPEALGDYFAGPNHTLPTSGTAKFSSPLGVDDFVKRMQYTYYSKEALSKVAGKVAFFAQKEGLSAHAKSAVARTEEKA